MYIKLYNVIFIFALVFTRPEISNIQSILIKVILLHMLARKPVNNVIMKFMNLTCKLQWDNHLDLQLLRIQVLILQNW